MRYLVLISAILATSCAIIPTPTPEVIKETVEVEVTREVLITSTPQPTASFTPAPPIILQEDFEEGAGDWNVGTDTVTSSEIANGELIINVSSPNFVHAVAHPDMNFLNAPFDLTVDIEHQSGPSSSYASINFRHFDSDNFAEFAMDGDGFISFGVFLDGQYYEIVPWTRVRAVSRGSNTVRLIDYGNSFSARINDEIVLVMPLEDLDPGSVGVSASTFDEGGAEWSFDNLLLSEVD